MVGLIEDKGEFHAAKIILEREIIVIHCHSYPTNEDINRGIGNGYFKLRFVQSKLKQNIIDHSIIMQSTRPTLLVGFCLIWHPIVKVALSRLSLKQSYLDNYSLLDHGWRRLALLLSRLQTTSRGVDNFFEVGEL